MTTCDIFCKVIDNYGDAGIAWRLAYGLAHDYGYDVRLWIDDITPLSHLVPDYLKTEVSVVPSPLVGEGGAPPGATGEEIKNMTPPTRPAELVDLPLKGGGGLVADLVIECLGAEIPDAYIQAVAERTRTETYTPKPLIIRYEYLTAEDWIWDVHLKPSPPPAYPDIRRYFFCPGFKPGSGGLLYFPPPSGGRWTAQRAGGGDLSLSVTPTLTLPPPSPYAKASGDLGGGNSSAPASTLLFTYPHQDLKNIYDYLSARYVHIDLPPGPAATAAGLTPTVPFRPQRDLDRAWSNYDYVFVRGEDSISQAVAAGIPAVWHIYPQADNAHWMKLNAFLDWYLDGLDPAAAAATRDLTTIWNQADGPALPALQTWLHHLPALTVQAQRKAAEIHTRGSALQNLVDFARIMG